MNLAKYSSFLIGTPGGKQRFSPEGIQVIEEATFKKVEKVLDKTFTEKQKEIIKSLLFFLKRDQNIELSQLNDLSDDYNTFNVIYKHKKIGDISYDKVDKRVWSRNVFSLYKDIKDHGFGVLVYVKLAILSSLNKDIIHSDLISFIKPEAENVWKRLAELGLANKDKKEIYKFTDLSFLLEKDFKIIDDILKQEILAIQ